LYTWNRDNTGSTVWADTVYRSNTSEAWLERNSHVGDIPTPRQKEPNSPVQQKADGKSRRQPHSAIGNKPPISLMNASGASCLP